MRGSSRSVCGRDPVIDERSCRGRVNGAATRPGRISLLLALLAACSLRVAQGEFSRITGEELAQLRSEGSATAVLILCHVSPVNSPESASALEIWKTLDQPLDGLVRMAALDCDEFPNDCRFLQAGSLPRAMLLSGGELTRYRGPLTRKSVGLFASNSISSPVAQLTFKAVPWWEGSELQGRRAVILLHEGKDVPMAFSALAVKLAGTHAFAEVRVVTKAVRDRFGVSALPAVVMGTSEGRAYTIYSGEMKRLPLGEFLVSSVATGSAQPEEEEEEEEEVIL